ncbi:DUF6586 family protein [Pseudomonas oryzihabitans]|uniref:DUF6586 family protein n=1 Tax=Pseudomonas oryzihabitans TaxID=47885 RepID=UPI0028960561|nr:DUF6586 family protein [Pseudomonas oryzihabitans]MDT3721808.1 DUF6586 family protein [Pseudomonas oryzihabitans]
MANERYTRTNQKLYFAGLALESWRAALAAPSAQSQGRILAEREACLFHLQGALLGLCQEVAGFYRHPTMDATSLATHLAPETLASAPSPEMGELIELASNPETWLAQLIAEYQRLLQPPQVLRRPKQDPTLPLIEAVSLEPAEPELPLEEVEAWRENLKQTALRFRGAMTEW